MKGSDREKILYALIILIVGSVFSYRISLVDKVMFRLSDKIDTLEMKHKPTNSKN